MPSQRPPNPARQAEIARHLEQQPAEGGAAPPHGRGAPLRFDILTTFVEMFASGGNEALNLSIPSRARAAGLVEWHAHDLRAFTHSKHRKTDDRPFGGGPGMVMMCQPVYDAVRAVEGLDPRPARRVLMSPQGRRLDQSIVEELAMSERVLIIAGHYEGLDERVIEELAPLELSLGDYVLSGGELAGMVLMDAVIRLLPGALGDEDSAQQDSHSVVELPPPRSSSRSRRGKSGQEAPVEPAQASVGSEGEGFTAAPPVGEPTTGPLAARLLDCPHFTKPREWMGREVPEVLLSGDHEAIARWRLEQRVRRTMERRPDLVSDEVRERLRALGLAGG